MRKPSRKPDPNGPRDYRIIDTNAIEFGGVEVERGAKTVRLTPSQASYYLAMGALGEPDDDTVTPIRGGAAARDTVRTGETETPAPDAERAAEGRAVPAGLRRKKD